MSERGRNTTKKMVILSLGEKKSSERQKQREGMSRLGGSKYELGRTLGEGNFGKVKFARDTDSGQPFAIKIIDKNKIIHLNITYQVCSITPPPTNGLSFSLSHTPLLCSHKLEKFITFFLFPYEDFNGQPKND